MDVVGLKKAGDCLCDLPLEIVNNCEHWFIIAQVQSFTHLPHKRQKNVLNILQHGLLC